MKDILDSGSKEDIAAKTQELSDSIQKIGQSMYKDASQNKDQTEEKTQTDKNEDKKSDKEEPVEGEVVE